MSADFLTVTAVAARLGLSSTHVVWLTNKGRLACLRDTAGRRLVTESEVQAYAEQRQRRQSTQDVN